MASLPALPVELVLQISSSLNNEDFLACRTASHRWALKADDDFVRRYCENLEINLTPTKTEPPFITPLPDSGDKDNDDDDFKAMEANLDAPNWGKSSGTTGTTLQNILDMLEYKDCANRVRKLVFKDSKRGFKWHDTDGKISGLLQKLLRQVSSVHTVIIATVRSDPTDCVMDSLISQPLPNLIELHFTGSRVGRPYLTMPPFIDLALAHGATMKTLTIQNVCFRLWLEERRAWEPVLLALRDDMSLEHLSWDELGCMGTSDGQSLHFRNQEFRELDLPDGQTYHLIRRSAWMTGTMGVRAGVNKVLELMRSERFDPEMPQ